jgi:hypothetical protein
MHMGGTSDAFRGAQPKHEIVRKAADVAFDGLI